MIKKSAEGRDPLETTHRCTACYFNGQAESMLPLKAFGVNSRAEYYSKCVAQGAWARCLRCQSEMGCQFQSKEKNTRSAEAVEAAMEEKGESRRTAPETAGGALVCATCNAEAAQVEQ